MVSGDHTVSQVVEVMGDAPSCPSPSIFCACRTWDLGGLDLSRNAAPWPLRVGGAPDFLVKSASGLLEVECVSARP